MSGLYVTEETLSGEIFHLLLRPVFDAVKTATAAITPLESIFAASTAETAARVAKKALILKLPRNTPYQESSTIPEFR